MEDKDYKKMLACTAVMIAALAVPYYFTSLGALLFICIMYADSLTKNFVQIIAEINKG
jgi:hypothetical protein